MPWRQQTALAETPSCPSGLTTVEALTAALSSAQPGSLRLPASPLRSRHQPAHGSAFLVWRAATSGCTVHGGTVELPERGLLLLAGAGAHFHGTAFTGGVVMCAGAHFSGTFHNCTFRATTLYAVHAAAVTLRSCRIAGAYPGLIASGEATVATLSDCRMSGCLAGVVVERGATLAADSCTISQADAGVAVNDAGSHAGLARCALGGGLSHSYGAHAVTISEASVVLRDCYISNFISAVYGLEGACAAEVHQLCADQNAHGGMFGSYSRATFRQCDIAVAPRPGVQDRPLALGAGTYRGRWYHGCARMQIEHCSLHGKAGRAFAGGILAGRGSSVAATLSRIQCTRGVVAVDMGSRAVLTCCQGTAAMECVVVMSDSAVRLQGGRYEGQTVALAVDGARITAADTEMCSGGCKRPRMAQVDVHERACVRLTRCCIRDGVVGFCCSGGSVHVVDSAVRDMRRDEGAGAGAGFGYMVLGGRVVVRGGTVERCALGVGSCDDPDRPGLKHEVDVRGVVFTDCAAGVRLREPEFEADITNCAFRGLHCAESKAAVDIQADEQEVGLVLEGAGRASVKDCSFVGFCVSIQGNTPDGVSVQHCSFHGSATPIGCIHILARGKAVVEDCTFTGVAEVEWSGLSASNGAECTVRRCRMEALASTAVIASHGGVVHLLDTVIDGCGAGVMVGCGAHVAAQDCHISAAVTGASFAVGGGLLTAKRTSIQAGHTCVRVSRSSGSCAVAKLADCALSAGILGLCVLGNTEAPLGGGDDAVSATMLRCRVSDFSGAGVMVRGPGKCRLRDTHIARCDVGVDIGEDDMELAEPCDACGRGGVQAERAAHAALLAGGGAVAGARCAHEGAVAQVALKNVDVADCEEYGVLANMHGCLEAQGLKVQGCADGVLVRRIATPGPRAVGRCSIFIGCQVIGCARSRGAREEWVVPGAGLQETQGHVFSILDVEEVAASASHSSGSTRDAPKRGLR